MKIIDGLLYAHDGMVCDGDVAQQISPLRLFCADCQVGCQVLAASFEALFRGMPEGKPQGGFLEAGEWDGNEYQFETQVLFYVGPDGKVWAQVCDSPDELPDMDESSDCDE